MWTRAIDYVTLPGIIHESVTYLSYCHPHNKMIKFIEAAFIPAIIDNINDDHDISIKLGILFKTAQNIRDSWDSNVALEKLQNYLLARFK